MKRVFTLVELLVVIAVISMLVAMCLPALVGVKAKTQQTACQNNLRQLSSAASQYEMDWEERYPGAWSNVSGDGQPGGWVLYKSFPNEAEGSFDPSQGSLYPYLRMMKPYSCPRQSKLQGCDYALNALLGEDGATLTNRFHPGMSSAKLATPSRTFLFIEEANNQNESTDDAYMKPPGNISSDRHDGMGSFSFCDGHVKPLYQIMAQYPNPDAEFRYEAF